MRTKKPRNKKYAPKPISFAGGLMAIDKKHTQAAMRAPMTDEQQQDLALSFRIAFDNMMHGAADEANWSTCVCSLNIALILAERGIGDEYVRAINDALEGAFRAKIRAGRTGKWGFDGEAIMAIKHAFDVHECQLEVATREELRAAIQEVHRRADAGNVFMENREKAA